MPIFSGEFDLNKPSDSDPVMRKVDRLFGELLVNKDKILLEKLFQATGRLGPGQSMPANWEGEVLDQKIKEAANACVNVYDIAKQVAEIDF